METTLVQRANAEMCQAKLVRHAAELLVGGLAVTPTGAGVADPTTNTVAVTDPRS